MFMQERLQPSELMRTGAVRNREDIAQLFRYLQEGDSSSVDAARNRVTVEHLYQQIPEVTRKLQ